MPLDIRDRYTALLGVPESHLLDDGVYTCQVFITINNMARLKKEGRVPLFREHISMIDLLSN